MLFEQLVLAITLESAVLYFIGPAFIGGTATWFFLWWRARSDAEARQREVDRLIEDAKERAGERLKAAEVEAEKTRLEMMARFEKDTAETRSELKSYERRLDKREENLEKKLDVLTTKERKIENQENDVAAREAKVTAKTTELDELLQKQRDELLRVARLTPEQARSQCLRNIESEVEREAGEIVERIISNAEENAYEKARHIIIQCIQRYAAEHTCETVVTAVDVPSDEMKGRVIGREGRNIRAFEKSTGVTVIVDDTPGIVQVSCFDPVRMEVARLALDQLIRDGRIHPTRIEEVVAKITKEVDQRVTQAGKDAINAANVNGINKKLVDLLGRLHFRTSYGQNVLKHSVEVAHLCGMMAEELGLDGSLARRCGLLHDIGKAIDHEGEGSHTKVGYEFARRANEPAAVLNAIQGHHGDIAATSPYTPLVAAADAISAARPGSRRESIERYIKRLEELESIATSFEGVNQAYAIEAGREVRVIVDSERINDRSSLKLARDIAHKIEEEMKRFPGEIKVTVLREVRATEFAISGRYRDNGSSSDLPEPENEPENENENEAESEITASEE